MFSKRSAASHVFICTISVVFTDLQKNQSGAGGVLLWFLMKLLKRALCSEMS